jgi:hypothetical protein
VELADLLWLERAYDRVENPTVVKDNEILLLPVVSINELGSRSAARKHGPRLATHLGSDAWSIHDIY